MKTVAFKLVWFDSLGAKSSCVEVRTPELSVLIDPGAAIMHHSFPAREEEKENWLERGFESIKKASKRCNVMVISHYHYDHFTDFDRELYVGKTVFAKNPNEYINDSQRERSEQFFKHLYGAFTDTRFEDLLLESRPKDYGQPLEAIPEAASKNFGDYAARRIELLRQGERWFWGRVKRWNRYPRIPELTLPKVRVIFAEGGKFNFGKTALRFSPPLFHGVEFSRVGWVFSTIIECGGEKLIHSSDVNGPVIEDYASWIIRENPDVLILDGPMTYMLGYTLNLTNFNRTIENVLRILEEAERCGLVIYDHHLPREPKFKERTSRVYARARKLGKRVTTAAEFMGVQPAVLRG